MLIYAIRCNWIFAGLSPQTIIHEVNCFEQNSLLEPFFIGFSKSGLLRCPTRRESVPLGSACRLRTKVKTQSVVAYYLLEGNSLFLKRLIFEKGSGGYFRIFFLQSWKILAGINYMFEIVSLVFADFAIFQLFLAVVSVFSVFVDSHALTCVLKGCWFIKSQDASSRPQSYCTWQRIVIVRDTRIV